MDWIERHPVAALLFALALSWAVVIGSAALLIHWVR